MSLAISWTIAAPGCDSAEVQNRLVDLRRIAQSLPFTVDAVQLTSEQMGFIAHYPRGSESTAIILRPNDGQWGGQGSTKTMYAGRPSHGGDEKFLVAHLSVVALLDAAVHLGFLVEVNDSGGFWHERDLKALVNALRRDDRFVSTVAEQVADMIQDEIGDAEMPQAVSDQELDHWEQNEAIAHLVDLVKRTKR